MTWLGISRGTTPVDPRPGVSELQVNTRMKVVNELQRRWGYQSSAIAQQDGPILGIISANGVTGNFLTFDLGGGALGEIDGFNPPPDQPVGPKRRKPVVVAGTPTAPVIIDITPVPPTGTAYPVGTVIMTANIVYDGLSGPLSYQWNNYNVGAGAPTLVIDNANPGEFDFNAGCIPDTYSRAQPDGLVVTTALNGFQATFPLPAYIVS